MTFEQYLTEHGVPFTKRRHIPVHTAQGLAQVEHVSGYMVAKPVVVRRKDGFAMCVLAAAKHVDLNRVARALNEKEVRLATEAEMTDLFPGCELGAEPPFGPMFGMDTVMDTQLKEDERLVMQSGRHTEAIDVKREDWERLCRPVVASIAAD